MPPGVVKGLILTQTALCSSEVQCIHCSIVSIHYLGRCSRHLCDGCRHLPSYRRQHLPGPAWKEIGPCGWKLDAGPSGLGALCRKSIPVRDSWLARGRGQGTPLHSALHHDPILLARHAKRQFFKKPQQGLNQNYFTRESA